MSDAERTAARHTPVLRERIADAQPPVPEHAVRLVEGVVEHAGEIDRLAGQ